MKRILALILLLFLFACQEDLPPNPPEPGQTGIAGKAIGGIPITGGTLPGWAAPILHTDIEPTTAKKGQTVTITVQKPGFVTTKFYAHGVMYLLNKKSKVWEKLTLDPSKSGKIIQQWAEDKAAFTFTVDDNRFTSGQNFVLTYWCIDTGARDGNNKKVWNCNDNKWGLGAFDYRTGYPEYLLEQDISGLKYQSSLATETPDGTEYEAGYQGPAGLVSVKVLPLKDSTGYKKLLSQNIVLLEPLWQTIANTCGFSQTDRSTGTTFTWFTQTQRIIVNSPAQDDPRITAYAAKYPPHCKILEELKRLAAGQTGYCGNSKIEQSEQCDTTNETACPGLCRPDCTCAAKGDPTTGVCGDFVLQQPNSKNTVETCEPPEKRDPVTGQVKSGSSCFVKDPITSKTTAGHCNRDCNCEPGEVKYTKCGNGNCEQDEGTSSCPADCPLDQEKPTITILFPGENQTVSAATINYTVAAKDNFGVNTCTAQTDSGTAENMQRDSSLWTRTVTLNNGTYTIAVTCLDKSGNKETATRAFSVQPSAAPAPTPPPPPAPTTSSTPPPPPPPK